MRDLLIFTVQNNRYAMYLKHIQRIIELPELTQVPNSHRAVNEIISYEDKVIKVMDFRKLIALATYEDELRRRFEQFRQEHKEWLDALSESVINGSGFELETSPHRCSLGEWIDGFISYDENVSVALQTLGNTHKQLHSLAVDILQYGESEKEKALYMLQSELHESYEQLRRALDVFTRLLEIVAGSLQKMLIYQNGNEYFGIKVDSIVDIACVDEATIQSQDTTCSESEFFEVEGVAEVDGMLVNIIKSITTPKSEVA